MTSRFRPKSKVNATGRNAAADAFHIRLYGWMLKSEAWRALTPAERCVYLELEQRYFGNNNGLIGLSVRAAAEACHISKDTAGRSLLRLVELGFTECSTPGGFSRKTPHSAEWRLTRAACDVTGAPPTKAFMKWRSGAPASSAAAKRGPKIRTLRSQNEDTSIARAA